MAQGIEIASTTDSQADIERAIGLDPTAEALKEERERTQAAPEPEQHSEEQEIARERTENGQGKSKVEKRIGRLTADKYAALRRAEQAEREAADLRAQLERAAANGHSESTEPDRSTAEPAVEAPTEQPEPVARRQLSQEHLARIRDARDRYPDWDEVQKQAQNKAMAGDVLEAVERLDNSADVIYFLARSDEYREQLNKMPRQVQQKEILRISADLGRSQGIIEDIQAFLARKPDVAELNQRAPQLRPEIAGAVRQATMEAENPGELTYHLLSHPDVVRKLNEMTPRQAFTETMRESARLELTSNGRSRPVSAAPAPIRPLGGTASTSTVDPDELSYQDYKAWRERNKRGYGVRR
jgi:hypothetical protein